MFLPASEGTRNALNVTGGTGPQLALTSMSLVGRKRPVAYDPNTFTCNFHEGNPDRVAEWGNEARNVPNCAETTPSDAHKDMEGFVS